MSSWVFNSVLWIFRVSPTKKIRQPSTQREYSSKRTNFTMLPAQILIAFQLLRLHTISAHPISLTEPLVKREVSEFSAGFHYHWLRKRTEVIESMLILPSDQSVQLRYRMVVLLPTVDIPILNF
jgi:hypothetical protein